MPSPAHIRSTVAAIVDQLPHNPSAYLILAQLYQRQGRHADASAILRRSLREEESAVAYRFLGSIQLDSGHAAHPKP